MRRTLTFALVAGALAAGAGLARADDAERLSLARHLLEQVHEDDALRAALPLLSAQMRESLARQGQKDEEAAAFVARYQARLGSEIGRYSDMMAEAYAKSFTEDELKAALAFNETPVGQKFIARRPALTQASFLAMQKFGRDVAEEVTDEMRGDKEQGRAPQKM